MAAFRKEEVDAARHRQKKREATRPKVVVVHGCVYPSKRHELASSMSRRNPVRARDGPRPA